MNAGNTVLNSVILVDSLLTRTHNNELYHNWSPYMSNTMKCRLYFIAFLACTITPLLSACDSSTQNPPPLEEPLAGEETQPTEEVVYTPIENCVGPMNIEGLGMVRAPSEAQDCVICEGALPPNFALQDLNPTSCGIGKYYGLDVFQGQVTFVVLLRSTCGYCHGQLEKLEQMRFELLAMGLTLHMLVINEMGTEHNIEGLTQRAQIPILQDREDVLAWQSLSAEDPNDPELSLGGDKDDMYIYNAQGELWRFLDDDDPSNLLNLSTDEGYTYLKEILIEALGE